jgi:uroporphyrinogen decarboxylase
MVGTGSQLLAVDHKVDRAAVKEATRGVTTLIGTVDPSGVLARGTPNDVRAAARKDLAVLAGGGGFILAPGCALPYDTPEANIRALVETVRSEGRYA